MMTLVCLLALVGVPTLAVQGKWYRGVYGAVALIGGLLAWLALQMVGPTSAAMTLEQRAGQEFINAHGDSAILLGLSIVIGGLFGAMLYRQTPKP